MDILHARDITSFLESQRDKETLRFITCGSVDDGKSTLIGRLLYESKMIYEDQLATRPVQPRTPAKISTDASRLIITATQSDYEVIQAHLLC